MCIVIFYCSISITNRWWAGLFVSVLTAARYPFIHYTVYKNSAANTSLTTVTAAAAATTTTTQPAVNETSRTSRDLHRNGRVRNHVHKQIVEITKSHGMYNSACCTVSDATPLKQARNFTFLLLTHTVQAHTSARMIYYPRKGCVRRHVMSLNFGK